MIGRFYRFLMRMYTRVKDDDIFALGAQMAYYLILSFFPFLIFLIALVNYIPISSGEVLRNLLTILPYEAYILVRDIVVEVVDTRTQGLASISGILALWFASNGIGAIISGLNKAYDEREKRTFVKVRFISIVFTLLISLVIVISFILLVFGGVIKKQLLDDIELTPVTQGAWNTGRYIFISSVILFIFLALFKYGPSRRLKWRETIPGAAFSTLGWLGTSIGFSYYVDNFANYSAFYGSIGGVAILLIWLYFSAVVILLGGELNAALIYNKHQKKGGSHI
ncbi:MAG: YihY/virulence factor BrkB family protein [Clostridiales bacterium]|nr:YihY/virulence factor BrkB family protein [Clostridiales bacterium]